jgi:hypothetical protein
VATLHARNFEPHLDKCRDDVLAGHPRQPGHQPTVTF